MLHHSKWELFWAVGAVFWMTSAAMAQTPYGQHATTGVPAEPVQVSYSTPVAPASPSVPFQKPAAAPLAADPFQYQRPSDNSEFVPARLASLPPEIKLVGVLMLEGREPIAAIRFPNAGGNHVGEVHYVREGEDIEIPRALLRTNRSRTAPVEDEGEILFLKVQKITSQHVEVRSQSNLADKHYLR
ncbi:MAG: hypothetical protein Q4D38_04855 [Planctomycetia bacterium]|nr:hypothetical protein [Planctomycetia bacterium]